MQRRILWLLGPSFGVLCVFDQTSIAAGKPIEMRWAVEKEIASVDPIKFSMKEK
jgi:hypothetical protein